VQRAEDSENKSLGSGEDVITQQELAAQLIFQNVEYPSRTALLRRFHNGARIEPGPLTIVHPYEDLGPFIVPVYDATRRSAEVRQHIQDASRALSGTGENDESEEFRRVARLLAQSIREIVAERNSASYRARNWEGFSRRVRDQIYAREITFMLWAAGTCVGYGLTRLALKAFGAASWRATEFAAA
jgi:hypothetical protein